MICTDVAARGIDIAGLPFVIQHETESRAVAVIRWSNPQSQFTKIGESAEHFK